MPNATVKTVKLGPMSRIRGWQTTTCNLFLYSPQLNFAKMNKEEYSIVTVCSPQSLKYLLFSPLQKKFADPWSRSTFCSNYFFSQKVAILLIFLYWYHQCLDHLGSVSHRLNESFSTFQSKSDIWPVDVSFEISLASISFVPVKLLYSYSLEQRFI